MVINLSIVVNAPTCVYKSVFHFLLTRNFEICFYYVGPGVLLLEDARLATDPLLANSFLLLSNLVFMAFCKPSLLEVPGLLLP